MITIRTQNGKIELTEKKTLELNKGRYIGYLYINCQNDRDFCDLKLNRAEVEELILKLRLSLLWP